MSYNDLWALAYGHAAGHHMSQHRTEQFAAEYARAGQDVPEGTRISLAEFEVYFLAFTDDHYCGRTGP